MQQARDRRAEETVAVVRDHEDGTGVDGWHRRPDGTNQERFGATGSSPGVDARKENGGGAKRIPREAGARHFGAARCSGEMRAR